MTEPEPTPPGPRAWAPWVVLIVVVLVCATIVAVTSSAETGLLFAGGLVTILGGQAAVASRISVVDRRVQAVHACVDHLPEHTAEVVTEAVVEVVTSPPAPPGGSGTVGR